MQNSLASVIIDQINAGRTLFKTVRNNTFKSMVNRLLGCLEQYNTLFYKFGTCLLFVAVLV